MSKKDLVLATAKAAIETANNLTDKLFDLIGMFIPPEKLIRYAQTKAEIKKIESKTDLELEKEAFTKEDNNLEAIVASLKNDPDFIENARIAVTNLLQERIIQDRNLAEVLAKAIPLIQKPESVKNIDRDLFIAFSNNAKNVSDDEMQEIWAKLLAEESNNPNSISKRTVTVLSNMSRSDAELFEEFSSIVIIVKSSQTEIGRKVLFSHLTESIIGNRYYEMASNLEELGLLHINSAGYTINYLEKTPKNDFYIEYFDESRKVGIKKNKIQIGIFRLTSVGERLFDICRKSKKDSVLQTFLASNDFTNNFSLVAENNLKS